MQNKQLFNKVVVGLDIPGIRKFSNQAQAYDDGVNLTLGQSGFDAPDFVKEAMIEAIRDNKLRYTHNKGLFELRSAISDYNKQRFGIYYDPETEIVITNGGSEAIDSIFRSILNEGDEVIIPCPSYSAYEANISLCGAKSILINTSETNYVPTKKQILDAITDNTKAIIFNYPSNPTGRVLSYKEMKEIVDVLKNKELFILSDEIYSENVYGVEYHSFIEFEEIRDQLFVINGISKSHAITGGRIGYVLSTPYAIDQVTKVHLYNTICAATVSQYGALSAFRNSKTHQIISKMNDAYIERRDYVYGQLKEMQLPVELPQGAFYIFPNITEYNKDSYEFAQDLLDKEHLAVVPGRAFSIYGEGHIRISYACSMEELEEGMRRLRRYIKQKK